MTEVMRVSGTVLPEGEHRDVHIVDGRITYEPSAESTLVAEGWIVPGLVDAHCHVGLDENGAVAEDIQEQQASSMAHGNLWWRVRPIIDGVYGQWTAAPDRRIDWQAPSGSAAPTVLSSTGDTTDGLSPILSWTPVSGANMYRVDIATDPGFTHVLESQMTTSTSWASRVPHTRRRWNIRATARPSGNRSVRSR